MFILSQLPFELVEYEGFHQFVNRIQPKFLIPTHNTLSCNCYAWRKEVNLRNISPRHLPEYV